MHRSGGSYIGLAFSLATQDSNAFPMTYRTNRIFPRSRRDDQRPSEAREALMRGFDDWANPAPHAEGRARALLEEARTTPQRCWVGVMTSFSPAAPAKRGRSKRRARTLGKAHGDRTCDRTARWGETRTIPVDRTGRRG
jgi:hypothetical protein